MKGTSSYFSLVPWISLNRKTTVVVFIGGGGGGGLPFSIAVASSSSFHGWRRRIDRMTMKMICRVLGHLLVCSLICLHHSLIRLLRTACFARTLRCAHMFTRFAPPRFATSDIWPTQSKLNRVQTIDAFSGVLVLQLVFYRYLYWYMHWWLYQRSWQ